MRAKKEEEEENKAKDLSSIKKWTEYYLKEIKAIQKSTEIDALVELKNEFAHFIFSIQEQHILRSTIQLEPEEKKWLKKLINELALIDSRLASQITMLIVDQDLLQEMEHLAFPEETSQTTERDYSSWGRSPMSYPKSFLDALKVAPVPGGK